MSPPRTIYRDLKQMGIRWEGHTKTGHWILYKQSQLHKKKNNGFIADSSACSGCLQFAMA